MRLPSGILPLDLQTPVPRVIRNVFTYDRLPGTLSCEEVPAPALASHGVTCAHVAWIPGATPRRAACFTATVPTPGQL